MLLFETYREYRDELNSLAVEWVGRGLKTWRNEELASEGLEWKIE